MKRRQLPNNSTARRRGAAAVEAAIVLGACLLLLLGFFDFARYVMLRQLLDNAVREGARLAVVSTQTLATTDIQNRVTNYLVGQSFPSLVVQVYQADPTTGANLGAWTNASLGQCIGVQATANFVPLTPTFSLIKNPTPMTSTCVMYSESSN